MLNAAILAAVVVTSAAQPSPLPAFEPDGITPHCFIEDLDVILIRGIVVSVKDQDAEDRKAQRIRCEIRIDRIYVNQSNEKADSLLSFFDAYITVREGSRSATSPARSPMKKGDVGAWILTPAQDSKLLVPQLSSSQA
jgi:hypothetical protein